MPDFVDVFGQITVGQIVVVGSAVVFLIKIYGYAKKYLINKYKADQEFNQRIDKVIDQAKHYPEWREQSLRIQKELTDAISDLGNSQAENKQQLKDLTAEIQRNEATACRYRILRFNDELLHSQRHSQEHFNQILNDIEMYKLFCATHPEYKNGKAPFAIENIERVYKQQIANNDFL